MKLTKLLGPAIILSVSLTALGAPPLSAHFADKVGNITLSQPAPAPTPTTNPLDAITWMKGGVWVAEIKDKDGAVATRIETRIRGSENSHLIKFTTTFVEHNRPHLQYEGVYLYNPQSKQIEFYYTDSEGTFTRGHAAFANGTLTQEFDIIHMNGQADPLRSLVVRDGENAYNWNVLSRKSGEWKELLHLRYVREGAAQ